MKKFKIFYSWQSDLPGNTTRNFIRNCIDEAIDLAQESEAIEAERDEATKGTTGSPNIVTTLFSKIDDCDLFIADVSLCFNGSATPAKKSPNPNVLLELGYAVKTLDWERVICLCNTDYGEEYPFDIAHNRITRFSLSNRNKNDVLFEISKIIFSNIRELKKLPPRAKAGMSTHVVGTYDFVKHNVIEKISPIEISTQESYVLHNQELLKNANQLFAEIQELTSKIELINSSDEQHQTDFLTFNIDDPIKKVMNIVNFTEFPVVWKDADKDAELINRWLGITIPENFFNFGKVKQVKSEFNKSGLSFDLKGTDEEKEKYEKAHKLSYTLHLLEIRKEYIHTFEGMCFIPLAIQNVSSVLDESIRVVVNVESGEIIEPNKSLICSNLEGLQGCLCRDDDEENDVGIICELFGLNEDGVIFVEDTPFNYVPRTPIITGNGLSYPEKTSEDYALELQEFIATSKGHNYYEFEIKNLRPGECKWLPYSMLIRPLNGKIKINYQIHSTHSAGDLNGTLEYFSD